MGGGGSGGEGSSPNKKGGGGGHNKSWPKKKVYKKPDPNAPKQRRFSGKWLILGLIMFEKVAWLLKGCILFGSYYPNYC